MTEYEDKQKLQEWTVACFARDSYSCQLMSGPATTVHHIIKRRFEAFRYDIDNGLSVGDEAHAYIEGHPHAAAHLIRALIGEERFQRLRRKFLSIYRYDYFATWFERIK